MTKDAKTLESTIYRQPRMPGKRTWEDTESDMREYLDSDRSLNIEEMLSVRT
jgi:hypothetical protein